MGLGADDGGRLGGGRIGGGLRVRSSKFVVQGSTLGGDMGIERFEDLEIWQEARELCKKIRSLTVQGEFARDFKLRDQIRGSSGSVMDCIAEGFERSGNKELIQFLSIAKGSCGETRSQSYRAFDYEYIMEGDLKDLLERTLRLGKKITRFIIYLKSSNFKGPKFS